MFGCASFARMKALFSGCYLTLKLEKNLEKEAEERGISCQRIIFAERLDLDKHLARHQWADLFLDTFTYNAHTTASDALWAGLPVLTVLGNSFPSRVGASIWQPPDYPNSLHLPSKSMSPKRSGSSITLMNCRY